MREVTVISSMKQRWTLRSQPHPGGYETQACLWLVNSERV